MGFKFLLLILFLCVVWEILCEMFGNKMVDGFGFMCMIMFFCFLDGDGFFFVKVMFVMGLKFCLCFNWLKLGILWWC